MATLGKRKKLNLWFVHLSVYVVSLSQKGKRDGADVVAWHPIWAPFQLSASGFRKAVKDGPYAWAPAIHVGNLDGTARSDLVWLSPLWLFRVDQQVEDLPVSRCK